MRGNAIAARAALICGAAGIACAIWSAVDDNPAHADDGLLPAVDHGLVDTVTSTVEQLPHTTDPTEPDRPHHLTEHTRDTARTIQPVIERITSTVDQVVQPVRAATPIDVPDLLAAPEPALPAAPAKPAAASLTATTPEADLIAPAAAQLPDEPADRLDPARSTPAPDPAKPHVPDEPDARAIAAMKPPTKTGADHIAATTPSGPATLALLLLGELLPRSDLPTGRTTHPEPGPA